MTQGDHSDHTQALAVLRRVASSIRMDREEQFYIEQWRERGTWEFSQYDRHLRNDKDPFGKDERIEKLIQVISLQQSTFNLLEQENNMLTNSTDRLTNIQLYRRYLTGDSFALKRLKIRHAALYIFQNDSDELSNCDICQHPLSHENENEIIFCDLCNLGVHQFCYKRDISLNIPEGDWFCLRCKTLLEDGLDSQMIRCMLCWDVEGSIIPLKKDDQWVHNTCVNWIKELYFEESSKARGGSSQSGMQNMATQECTMSGSQPEEEDFISGMSGIVVGKVGEEKLYGEECEYCRHQFGVCIKCDREGCQVQFHVRCAIRNQLIRRFDRIPKPNFNKFQSCVKQNEQNNKLPSSKLI